VAPTTALGPALVVETAGSALLLLARTQPLAYAAVILLGIGSGLSYIVIAAAFSSFLGRKAFVTTTRHPLPGRPRLQRRHAAAGGSGAGS
jgi:hypothetical protein